MQQTTIRTYAAHGAHETHGGTGASSASSTDGYATADVFLRDADGVRVEHYGETPGCGAFTSVQVDADHGGLTLYVRHDADAVAAAVALRDALTAAIRAARKGAAS